MLYRVGKTYYIDIGSARGRVRRSARTTDRREAQAFHDRVRGKLWRQDQLEEAPEVTWLEAVRKWREAKNPGLPDRYRIGAVPVPDTTVLPLDLAAISKDMQGCSPATWNRLVSLLLVIHKLNGISLPGVERRPTTQGRTRWLSVEEWSRLRKKLLKESKLLEQAARFTLATGLRENNVLELEWKQVDLKRRTAFLHADQVKNREALGVPLNDDAMAVLAERRAIDRRWVFGNPDYPLTKASNKAWYAAVKKAKLVGFRWHDLRHTWASWAVMSGVRLEELQKLGGWKTYSMVTRYAHLSSDHLAAAAAKIRPISRR